MRRGVRHLKNIRRHRKGGKLYLYHRHTGARLPDLPETHPDFVKAWLAEEHADRPRKGGASLEAAVDRFLHGPALRDLSPAYGRLIERHLSEVAQAYGHVPAHRIERKHIQADLDRLPAGIANKRLKAWRLLCKTWAEDPTRGIRRRPTPATGGFPMVTPDQWAAYRARWPVGTPQRLAGELLFWTGARTKDAVALGPRNVDHNGLLTYGQTKTGGTLAYVPWTSPLPAWADWDADRAILMRCIGRGATFLETDYGQRSVKGLGNLVSDAFHAIGIDRSAHGFRKLRLTLIAEAGGSTSAIMAWGGHMSLGEAERYTRAADRRRTLLKV